MNKEKSMELKGSKTEKNLQEAFSGESQANRKKFAGGIRRRITGKK